MAVGGLGLILLFAMSFLFLGGWTRFMALMMLGALALCGAFLFSQVGHRAVEPPQVRAAPNVRVVPGR